MEIICIVCYNITQEVLRMRLDKYLADCGEGTRSEIKKLIRKGAVSVTGAAKITPEMKIDEDSAEVFVEGRRICYKKYVYLMLNKPQGVICATDDNRHKTVIDLVPEKYSHYDLFPAGRLDIDTVGLCLLTNDGAVSHRILSPSHHIPKTYIARLSGVVDEKTAEAFSHPMDLGDFTTMPAQLEILDENTARVTIAEGKFHQIKRMFEKVGLRVEHLKRVAMNRLTLDETLGEGEMRELTDNELELLTYEE